MAKPMAIATRSVLACRDTLAAGFSERHAGSIQMAPLPNMPSGVSSMVRDGHPHIITRLDAAPIADLHDEVIAMAWRDGAWDVQVVMSPPLDGPSLGVVVGNRQFADDLLADQLVAAAMAGRLIQWTWMPLLCGPALRRKAHQAKDATLNADGGRDGPPRAGLTPLPLHWRQGRVTDIRLGIRSEIDKAAIAARHRPRGKHRSAPKLDRATAAQIAYLTDLWAKGQQEDELPGDLTVRQASALITKLTGKR